jgi:hypothetical protein
MGYALEFEETFEADALDRDRWFPYYLPHWSSRERAAARYALGDGVLRLLIEAGQEPWCPELDDEVRVSSLQTGVFAGPVGSTIGQHRFNTDAVVREVQPTLQLYTPHHGRIELRARASDDPRTMVALWMMATRTSRIDRRSSACARSSAVMSSRTAWSSAWASTPLATRVSSTISRG